MTWLLEFMEGIFRKLPDHLNVTYIAENEELEVAILEMDEQFGMIKYFIFDYNARKALLV